VRLGGAAVAQGAREAASLENQRPARLSLERRSRTSAPRYKGDMSQRVLILGATSAIAAQVARRYVERGDRLHLVGRNVEKLSALVSELPASSVTHAAADFDQLGEAPSVIARAVEALGGIDVALIAHGALGEQRDSERDFDAAEAVLRTNFISVVALLVPLANRLEAQGSGVIGVITSVAGDRGRPRNYTYGAAKGGLNVYLQGLRSRLFNAGVGVVTLKLGPVETPMTATHAKNALFAQPGRVAAGIIDALERRTPEAYIPSFWGAIMPVVKNTPERLFQLLPFLSGR
jgi:decaprenylphospho-beta-D-erythro-pentofuranosid-2-ulose 2-reductase